MSWWHILSCKSFSTVDLYLSGKTSCVLFAVFLRWMPSSSMWSLSHPSSRHLLRILKALSSCPDELLFLILHCITGPMFLSPCYASWISTAENGLCVSALTSVHLREVSTGQTHGGLEPWVSTAWVVAATVWCQLFSTPTHHILNVYRHSWQTVSVHIFFAWTISNGKMKVRKLCYPSASSCVELGTWQDLCKRIIITEHCESGCIIQVISEFFCDCPL